MPRKPTRDDGFSLVEVTFAAFVAFFVLTALFSIVVVANQLNAVSRDEGRATALANMVIEQARSLPYWQVGIQGGNPAGELKSSETTTYEGRTYTVQREVSWIDDAGTGGTDYKQLVIRIRWGSSSIRLVTYIRDRNEEAYPPTVTWVQVPPSDVIIFNSTTPGTAYIWDPSGGTPNSTNGSAILQASAEATGTSGLITRLEFWTQSRLLPDASWTPNTASVVSPAYALNSLLTDDAGVRYFPDGLNMVKAEAWTAAGLRDYVTWSFVVDNDPPVWSSSALNLARPAPSRNQDRYNSRLSMSWTPPRDGGAAVTEYTLGLAANGSSTFSSHGLSGVSPPYQLGTGAPPGVTTEPFRVYRAYLSARSPRGLTASSATSSWVATNPRLTGTIKNNATKKSQPPQYEVNLSVTPPSAATLWALGATSVKYDVAEASSWNGVDLSTKKTGYTDLDTSAIRISNPNYGMYYQVEAKLYNGTGQIASVFSNVIGPSGEPNPLQSITIPVP